MTSGEMYISEIHIENYKSIEDLTIRTEDNFNVIIGVNNIGKSTIFEALLLWKQCYDRSILANGEGFYKPTTRQYLLYDEIDFLRMSEDTDLFYDDQNSIKITLKLAIEDKEFTLGYTIERTKMPRNSYFRIFYTCYDEFNEFLVEIGRRPREAIYIHKTQPISTIPAREPFMNHGQILKKISRGKSYEVLRNKIIKNKKTLQTVMDEVSKILGTKVEFTVKTNKRSDEYIALMVNIEGNVSELHLQGSGILQIAEIFSSIEYFETALNIILLDEPDSHIHSDLQDKLIENLNNGTPGNQVFIISHNERFVDTMGDSGSLFFLNESVKRDGKSLKKILPAERKEIIKELGTFKTTLERLHYSDQTIIVEGKNDKNFIENILEKYYTISSNKKKKDNFIISVRGKDELKQKIHVLQEVLTQITDISNLGVVYDKDFHTRNSERQFKEGVERLIKTEKQFVFSHEGYCVESVFFSDIDKLSSIIRKITGVSDERIKRIIDSQLASIKENVFKNCIFEPLNNSFQTQSQRNELQDVEFVNVIREISNASNLDYVLRILNKDMIDRILKKVSDELNKELISINDIEEKYLDNIESTRDFYQSHLRLIELIVGE